MAKGPLSKSALIQLLADQSENKLTRKSVKGILETMATVGHAEMKKNGVFVVPARKVIKGRPVKAVKDAIA